MKTAIILLLLGLFASLALADVDSLRCRLIDWLDAPSNHNFDHYPGGGWPAEYNYTGTQFWDLAMGDSFMVWLPGSREKILVDANDTTTIDTTIERHSGSEDVVAIVIDDSIFYYGGGVYMYSTLWNGDSVSLLSRIYTPSADYHFAALEDSFLYTTGGPAAALTCINVADPESIFIYRTLDHMGGKTGLEVINGYTYTAGAYSQWDDSTYEAWPYFTVDKADMINSAIPEFIDYLFVKNRYFGGIATDGTYLFYVNSSMTDYPDWAIGESDLYVWGTDTTYNFEAHWDSTGVFGVDVLNEHLIAVGFEHGFSVLNIDDLDNIYEVAYYMDTDSTMDITHFVMKESRVYAMGHPRDDYVRLYMFDLGDSVVSGQAELQYLPEEFRFFNYPNPFNSSCRIKFAGVGAIHELPLWMEIYDINGRLVDNIPIGRGNRGPAEIIWRPENLPSGIYLAKIKGTNATANIIYMK
ncbi:hypothetical protein DRQ36_05640 [bacterium]|nr:MAG: hypothetical protein DRQ36_05640 [bacterium]